MIAFTLIHLNLLLPSLQLMPMVGDQAGDI